MNKFKEAVDKNIEKLELYVPVVARVHGGTHPEFHEVKKIYNSIISKIKESDTENLADEFKQLREITDNYSIPNDVCETYEAVYNMIKEIDEAYNVK